MKTFAPKSFIARLARHFDLLSYIEPMKPKKYGDHEYALTCPECDKDEKLWVNAEKRTAFCYFCEQGYDVIGLVKLLEDTTSTLKVIDVLKDHSKALSNSLRGEVDRVLKSLDIIPGAWQDEKLPTIALPEGFVPAFSAKKLPAYFAERGISKKRATIYDLGWCESGFFKNRLIVPVKQEGRLVTFHARYMQKKPPGDIKKVRYPKGSKTSRMLFNIDRAKHQSRIVICEDVFSAMAVGREGVGTFGTSISKYQLALLLGSAADEIVLMWDPDAIDKAYEEAERLSEHWTVRVVELRGNRDPDEYSKADLARILAQAKASRGSRLFARRVRARLRSISI